MTPLTCPALNRLISPLILAAVVLCGSSPGYASVFTWKDSAGNRHYTNRADEIPERYRLKAKEIYAEQSGQPNQQQALPLHQETVQKPLPVTPVAPVTAQPIATPPKEMQRKERRIQRRHSEED